MSPEPRVVLLHGDEGFLVREEAQRLLGGWRSELVSDFGFESLEAARLSAEQLRDAILQAPFLDPYRVVAARSLPVARADALTAALAEIPETTRVLLTFNGRLTPGSRLAKTVAALSAGLVREFGLVKGRKLNEWASQRARQLNLSPAVAAAVVRASPPDLGVIDSELRKLEAYVAAGQRLDAESLSALLAGGREEEVFQLTDRLLPRVRADAWRVTENLMLNGVSATTIAYRMARHFSLVLGVKTRQDKGQELSQVLAEMREHPFVLQKAFEAARTTTAQRLEQNLQALLRYEWEVKSGQVDADWGLEAALGQL